MDKTRFWQLIEQTYVDDAAIHDENLKAKLIELGADEIAAFGEIYYAYLAPTYSWELWAVAYIINGGCSDDSFEDFRSMLIRRGREFYTAMMADPEAAALRFDFREEDFHEMFSSCIPYAYEEVTKEEMPESKVDFPAEPTGYDWREEDLSELYPRLCEKFG